MTTDKENMNMTSSWNGFAASIPGGGHVRRGIPCQDASLAIIAPRPALIVCDGRGSASLSHFGAQEAVKAFRSQVAILEPFLVNLLDGEEDMEQWIKFCRIMYRTLMQVKYELAEKHNTHEKEFDFTVVFAIAGKKRIGCFQVGDGSLVLRQNGVCQTVFLPEKGEFANQTHFLRPGGEVAMKFQYAMFDADANTGIAATSDGPEHLMFHLADMKPSKIFDMLLDDLCEESLSQQDLMDYLTRKEWVNDPRGDDDRSLAVLARVKKEAMPHPGKEGPREGAATDGKSAMEAATGSEAASEKVNAGTGLETEAVALKKSIIRLRAIVCLLSCGVLMLGISQIMLYKILTRGVYIPSINKMITDSCDKPNELQSQNMQTEIQKMDPAPKETNSADNVEKAEEALPNEGDGHEEK